jgi:hypothetical protein
MGPTSELSMRAEVITQAQNDVGTAVGDQLSQDLTPDLDSFVLQVGYSFRW